MCHVIVCWIQNHHWSIQYSHQSVQKLDLFLEEWPWKWWMRWQELWHLDIVKLMWSLHPSVGLLFLEKISFTSEISTEQFRALIVMCSNLRQFEISWKWIPKYMYIVSTCTFLYNNLSYLLPLEISPASFVTLLITSAKVVKMSLTTIYKSPSQDIFLPNDQTTCFLDYFVPFLMGKRQLFFI